MTTLISSIENPADHFNCNLSVDEMRRAIKAFLYERERLRQKGIRDRQRKREQAPPKPPKEPKAPKEKRPRGRPRKYLTKEESARIMAEKNGTPIPLPAVTTA